MKKTLIALIATITMTAPAFAQVSVTAPWIRATVPAQKSTGAYMYLMSGSDVRLVGVSSPVAAVVELHKMEMSGTTMKMRQVDSIALPAGRGVNLASGGYHIMLVGLKQQLKDGDAVPLTLEIEHKNKKPARESVTVRVPVKPVNFVSPQAGATPAPHH
ncbi:MAG: copper chaperone PCu(A)C [Pseudomonadota bacterium]